MCKAQLSLQVIYLSLHGLFVIQSLGYVTTHMGMASAGLCGVYAPFPKPSVFFIPAMLRVREITLLLGSCWLRLMGACFVGVRSCHVRMSFSLAHKFFPQTALIVGSKLWRSFTSTQVLPTDGANCERTQTQQAQYNEFGKEMGLRTGP